MVYVLFANLNGAAIGESLQLLASLHQVTHDDLTPRSEVVPLIACKATRGTLEAAATLSQVRDLASEQTTCASWKPNMKSQTYLLVTTCT